MDRIRVSTFGRSRNHDICVRDGLYAAVDIEVEVDVTQSSKSQMSRLRDGVWDIVHTNADNVYWWNEDNGTDFLIVLAMPGQPNQDFIVRPEITSYEDLRGRAIAVDASESGFVTPLRLLLKQGGLAAEGNDYTFLEVGATQQRIDSIKAGETFGGMIGSEQAAAMVADGFRRLDTINRLYTKYSGTAATRRDWAASHADLLLRYLRAYLRAAAVADGIGRDQLPPFGWDGLREMMAMRKDVGLLRGEVEPLRFADDSYYKQAVESL